MNRKISVILLVIFSAICIMGFASCKNDDENNNGKEYTVIWKNHNGEILETDTNVKEGTIPTFDGATPTKQGDEQYTYAFAGWDPQISEAREDITYTATFTAIDNAGDDDDTGSKTDDANYAPVINGKTVLYGLYPQTHVSDEALIAELNKLTPSETNGWYLHDGNYYAKQTAKVYNNENYTFDDGAPIVNGDEYWFKCEAIEWRVLSDNNGLYYLLSSKLLDARSFYLDYSHRTVGGNTIYANNYEQSAIRQWLNNDFYNIAFALNNSYIKETAVDNGAATTEATTNSYACASTHDKVYLPSYNDYLNPDYGFAANADETSATRECKTTDYARAQGAWCNATSKLQYNGSYWTRSPSSEYYYCAWNVNSAGFLSEYAVDGDSHCVRPCITIEF